MSTTKTKRNGTEIAMLNATRRLNEALYQSGVMTDEEGARLQGIHHETGARPLNLVRGLDVSTLTPELPPERIRALREREGASQAVFAKYLGVATATLSQWERGVRRPEGPALRLMGLAERHGLEHIR